MIIKRRLRSIMASGLLALGLTAFAAPDRAEAQDQPFVGQLMLTAGSFCPRGWFETNGQLLSISQYTALFSLLGTVYGGDGRTTFGVPELRGRAPIHHGEGPGLSFYPPGQRGGSEQTALTTANTPLHSHIVNATNEPGDKLGPGTDFLAYPNNGDPNSEVLIYHDGPPNRQMDPGMIEPFGPGAPFSIQSPYLVMRYCIAYDGIYPPRP